MNKGCISQSVLDTKWRIAPKQRCNHDLDGAHPLCEDQVLCVTDNRISQCTHAFSSTAPYSAPHRIHYNLDVRRVCDASLEVLLLVLCRLASYCIAPPAAISFFFLDCFPIFTWRGLIKSPPRGGGIYFPLFGLVGVGVRRRFDQRRVSLHISY
jgi:hypothetical protein